MEILAIPVGSYQTNCYIVWQAGREDCVLIDPGDESKKILEEVERQGKQIAAILLTHGHFDHVGAVRKIAEKADCPVYLHPAEKKLPFFMTAGPLYSTDGYEDTVSVAGLDFQILHTPGHTPGSVCLLCDGVMFSGDTLFAGSCGRTDFPSSNPGDMAVSLKKLKELPGDYRVYPGHAEDTTLSYERENNPYM